MDPLTWLLILCGWVVVVAVAFSLIGWWINRKA